MTTNRKVFATALFISLCFYPSTGTHHQFSGEDDSQINPRVLGGHTIGNGSIVYQLYLSYNRNIKCGATLVEVYGVHIAITANHCVWLGYPYRTSVMDPKKLMLTAGDRKLNDTDKTREQRRKVTKVVPHPGYDGQFFTDDIAILFLEKDFIVTDYVAPLDLPGFNWAQPSSVKVSGWGSLAYLEYVQNELRWAQIPILELSLCKKYNAFPAMKVTDNELCVGKLGGNTLRPDICSGDSGGPAVAKNETTGLLYLAGLTSHTLTLLCGNPYAPTIFTWVPPYMDWIRIEVSKYREENGLK